MRLTVRAIALLSASSAAIHQLRYAIGYGDAAPHALAEHPHAYMTFALPAVMTIALVSLALALMRVARGSSAPRGRRPPLWLVWLACSVALASIFGVQETLEGSGAVAGGGWIGLALAIPAGLLVALALRGAQEAEVRVPALVRIRALIGIRVFSAPPSLVMRTAHMQLSARGPPLRSPAQ